MGFFIHTEPMERQSHRGEDRVSSTNFCKGLTYLLTHLSTHLITYLLSYNVRKSRLLHDPQIKTVRT